MIPLNAATAERVVAVAHATLEEFDSRAPGDYSGGEAAFRLGELSHALRSVLALLPDPPGPDAPTTAATLSLGQEVPVGSLVGRLPRRLLALVPGYNGNWPIKLCDVLQRHEDSVIVIYAMPGGISGKTSWRADRMIVPLKWEDAE
ncbi:hypothetical protein Ppa06_57650 [Planomonospora parontospora subsp. parontospora]|uniref:Uncharacterized protein n=2 Tax=Planomonospora parontospora TaxID=58119 RepID=A0AA37F7K6_9ACTN|nr:hypothetical protein [Planomonospora parontospora]GGK90692.1 hypothetical protein GCM10010126_57660 [Planomonospora parontospora]GII11967.1 hypothetical protein Ppa06_57650 [Planomonospora parontospora subsp. parontospora]